MGDIAEYMTDNYMPRVEKKKFRKRKDLGRKKRVAKSELVLVPIKIHPREIRAIKAQAKKYAQGNFSAWLRHAGLRYRPKRGEVVDTVTMPSSVKKKKR